MWKKEWGENVTTIEGLAPYLPVNDLDKLGEVTDRHPMSIPKYYLDLIDKEDPNDPIKILSVPSVMELDMSGDYDTSGEAENTKFAGVQHKYHTTMLVLTTNACFMYCRHCFRKRLVGYSNNEINNRLDRTIEYLNQNTEVNNVLLSGGDSFCLDTSVIKMYLERLSEVEHLDFVRFGTRSLVVFPQRIYEDKELLEALKETGKKKRIDIVTQFNHPRELTEEVQKAMLALKEAGVTVHNQTVMLKGVNTDPKVLGELLNKLVRFGINPYYVFQCRPVTAVKNHFQMPLEQTWKIAEGAKAYCNGFGKRFKLAMSHPRGKIEIIGVVDGEMVFRFHQAKHPDDMGKMFKRKLDPKGRWLDQDLNFIE
jgi:KamA family protein